MAGAFVSGPREPTNTVFESAGPPSTLGASHRLQLDRREKLTSPQGQRQSAALLPEGCAGTCVPNVRKSRATALGPPSAASATYETKTPLLKDLAPRTISALATKTFDSPSSKSVPSGRTKPMPRSSRYHTTTPTSLVFSNSRNASLSLSPWMPSSTRSCFWSSFADGKSKSAACSLCDKCPSPKSPRSAEGRGRSSRSKRTASRGSPYLAFLGPVRRARRSAPVAFKAWNSLLAQLRAAASPILSPQRRVAGDKYNVQT